MDQIAQHIQNAQNITPNPTQRTSQREKDNVSYLWTILEKRYGPYDESNGLSVNATKQIWVRVLGMYSKKDLEAAALKWFSKTTYLKWPTEGALKGILDELWCKPEKIENALPAPQMKLKEAIKAGGNWYHTNIIPRGCVVSNKFGDFVKSWWDEQPETFKKQFEDVGFSLKLGLMFERGVHNDFTC